MQQKVVVVTGASRGIGKATALAFGKKGYNVIVNYNKSSASAKETVKEIKKMGSGAVAVKADVSKNDDVKKLMNQAIQAFGRIDVLVNNAGIVIDTPFSKRTSNQWKKTLAVDLIGVFLCAKEASKYMKKNGFGRIINISSTNGTYAYHPDSIDYSAAKAGVINLTKSMAMELSPTILVNTIAPGWVSTPMNDNLPQTYVRDETKKIFLKRFGKPEEIAKVAVFLASDDASYVNGTTITVDGGYQ